ncbi:MAG: Coenzyme F420 hydrogenase/dehydrogenase, beta subunit C-terminal domain [Candidatus Lokiarchaeota archaeon]
MESQGEYLIKEKEFSKLLKTLLKEKVVNKVLGAETKVSRKTKEEDRFTLNPIVYEKPEDIPDEFPLSNFMAYGYSRTDSAAKYLHKSLEGAKEEKIGLIARPCDTRALVELAKLRQVNLDNLFIIALEDRGLAVNVGRELRKFKDIDPTKIVKEKIGDEGLIFKFEDGKTQEVDIQIAENCSRCTRKIPVLADISVSDVGLNIDSDEIILKVYSDEGLNLFEKSSMDSKSLPEDIKKTHENKLDEIIQKAREKRTIDLEEWKGLPQEEKIDSLKKCTMCGMCIRGCPVCYCVDCILQQKRKDKNINAETYQLTRISHVADRCIECGNCDNNCPMNLPLSLYFQSLNDAFTEKFKYTPGESVEDIPFRSGKAIREMELEKT